MTILSDRLRRTGGKQSGNLPPLRVSERLEIALLRMAAADNRSLSEYIKLVLHRHAFGHAESLTADSTFGSDVGA